MSFALLISRQAVAADFNPAFLLRASHSVVRIEADRPNHGIQVGTGVVLAQGKVATACHVVRDASGVYVIHTGRRYMVSGLQAMPERDVCVFSVPELDTVPAVARPSTELEIGEPVAAVGFSGGGGMQWRGGEVERTHHFDGGLVLQTSAPFTSGASGGPLFDTEGRVVGLLSFRMRGRGPQFYSVPVEWAIDVVEMQGVEDVADTRFDKPPFWARSRHELPFFMQAGSLETEQRWQELRALCEAWRLAEPDSGEPAFIESGIDERLGRLEAARSDLEQAVTRDPDHALAWSALVRVRLGLKDLAGARNAYSQLATLSMRLASRLLAEQAVLGR